MKKTNIVEADIAKVSESTVVLKNDNINTIINGNSSLVLKTFPNDYIDLTVTSPPYDNIRDYNGYSFDFKTIATELYRVTKPGGIVVWVVGDSTENGSESGTSFRQALEFLSVGFKLHDTMIYEKNTSSFPARRYQIYANI